jgi:GH15 family glucan-1,4-alpha-glucosidase
MAWVAIDRWVQMIELLELTDEPIEHWQELRGEIHDTVCRDGFNDALGSFTQYFGSDQLDASLLMMGLVGFLPPTDHRLVGTIEAVQRELLVDGFVLRYRTDASAAPSDELEQSQAESKGAVADTVDGLPPGEGSFLLTTFWLVDSLVLIGKIDEATTLFERLLALRNDVGLLAEEYDTDADRMVGNFPQAFSHIGVINSAANLSMAAQSSIGPLTRRAGHSWRG